MKMKFLISVILMMCVILFADVSLDKNMLTMVYETNRNGDYELARELLREMDVNSTTTLPVMEKWLELDEGLANELGKYKKSKLTKGVYDDEICSTTEKGTYEVAKEAFANQIPVVGMLKGAYDAYHYVKGDRTDIYAKEQEYRDNIKQLERDKPDLFDIDQAKKIIAKYDVLKKSMINLYDLKSKFTKDKAENKEFKEFKEARPVLNRIRLLKERIKKDRTDFVSYTVISPYLANTERLVCLSNAKELVGHDEDDLREAAKTMARGAYRDLLLQSHQNVRDQFADVYQKLKETAGDKELEDLKVIQTLADSASKAKKTGADLWWK